MVGIAVCDIRNRRIPNVLVGLILGLQIMKIFIAENPVQYKGNILNCLVLLFVGYVIYSFRFIGAGDIKLLIVILVGIPEKQWIKFALVTMATATIWSLAVLSRHHLFRERFRYLQNYVKYMVLGTAKGQYWSKDQGNTHTIPLSIPMILGYLGTMGGGII